MREIKGYVVRGTALGDVQYVEKRDILGAAVSTWTAFVMNEVVRPRIFRVHSDGREERLPSYEEALTALSEIRGEVEHALNRGECPPSTLRALLRIAGGQSESTDPIAALEAAERRLLEAGGWAIAEPDVYGTERWSHPTWQGGRSEGRQVALTIERRRIAAKGGA